MLLKKKIIKISDEHEPEASFGEFPIAATVMAKQR